MIKLNKRFGVNFGIYAVVVLIALVLTSFLVYQNYFSSSADVVLPDIALNSSQKFQTITGWEALAGAAEEVPNSNLNLYKDNLYNKVANDAEINRVRLEVYSGIENNVDYYAQYKQAGFPAGTDPAYLAWRTHRYATVNDDSDPNHINPSGFQFSRLDDKMNDIVLPLKQKFDAKGEHLQINLEYVAFTSQNGAGLQYIHNDPQEYAEYILAVTNYLKTKYNITPDTWEILLEPDNVSQWSGTLIGQAIVATAAKLTANGYQPRFVVPSNSSMANAITYFNQLVAVPGVLPYIKEISYHRYSGVSDANLQIIANLAKQYGLQTSMLEWWDTGNTYKILHKDLKMGLNSAWQQGTLAGLKSNNPKTTLYLIDNTDRNNPTIEIHPKTKFFKQYYKYIRPGAVRIGATSGTANLDPLSFINSNGKYIVEVDALAAGSFTVSNLPAGTYGVKYATANVYDVDNPDVTINTGQKLTTSIPAVGLVTIYQKTAKDVTAPSAPTGLSASYANQQAALSWTASTDNIGVSGYNIYRNSSKIGASTTTTFADLTVASSQRYAYEVTAFDADSNESAKSSPANLTIPDFQPPVLSPIGNKAVQVGKKLQFAISATDPDGNPLTYSASNLPTGANFNSTTKSFDWTPTSAQIGVNANIGFSVSDGTNNDSENIAITVTANNPPVLAPIGNQTVDAGAKLQFTISATDKDNDPLTYSAGNLPSGATFSATTRTFSWAPTASQVGIFSDITFTASDNIDTDTQKISITVKDNTVIIPNKPPVLAAIGNQSVRASVKLQFTISATDPESNPLTYSATNLPSGANFDAATRTFSWMTTAEQAGLYTNIGFSVSDGTNTDSENIAITVIANNPPVLAPIGNQSATVGTKLQFTISASDKDGDPLTYSATNLPNGANLDTTARTFSWTPASSQVGSFFNVAFSASDSIDTDIQPISIIVTPDVIPPTAPTQFKASFDSTNSQVNLSWQAGTDNLGVAGYQLSRSTLAGLGFQVIASVNNTTLNFDDKQITPGKTYYYQVQTFDAAKNYSASASASAKTYIVDRTAPSTPTLKGTLRKNARSAEVEWTESTDNVAVKGYFLYRDGLKMNTTVKSYRSKTGQLWYFIDEQTVQAGNNYVYYVKAEDTSGNLSTNSNQVTLAVPQNLQIANLQIINVTSTSAIISWSSNVKSTGSIDAGKRLIFNIHGPLNQTYTDVNKIYDHKITLTNLNANTTYDFQINGSNAEKTENSVTSVLLNFRTAP